MNSPKKLIRIAVSAALAASMLLPNAFALYPAKVKADALYLREAPEGNIIATLPQDTVLAVVNNSNSWFKVVVNGREGYVSGEYLTGTLTSDFNLGTGHIVCDTTVNLREQPNTSSSVLASLSNSTAVSVTGVYQGWYKVSCNGKNGYVHPDYITFAAVQTPAPAENKAPVTPDSNVVSYTGTSEARAEVLEYAAQFLGTPYVYGGSSPSGFDCSGFTSYVFNNTVGSIPRVAQSQFNATTHVSREELLPGDLVFFGSSASSISHVGIYVGDDTFIHSPHTGDVVKYESLSGNYASRFQGGGRVIFD
ncbi:C40 family peptidase [Agathobaculum sp. NSJ-28]|uniref:C40 family peptidase n=2 Tax=Agathobaculum TaxID=2048137 RepID=A0A923RVH3_9FIRM|nr:MULTISPECIES: C40 family peptidase [Butyricicoccaceae]MBC5724141.1 C40 family peptidase [Agathobaculum faecis]MCU6787773.1 NlpC/P60 family protein [Agathobaculum ammoniilyticum]WOC76829.1 NlpC/P60 family protein [Intestinibacillus sp. NTUH-41-i26]SCI45273.1 Probable endopeptidase p60 precursor [uncultured Butyricicoccus sp.]